MCWCLPSSHDATFVAAMEDVLEVAAVLMMLCPQEMGILSSRNWESILFLVTILKVRKRVADAI